MYWKRVKTDCNEQDGWMWCEFIWLMLGIVTGFCEYSNEPLRPIQGREFIQQAKSISFSKITLIHGLG